MKGAGAAGDRVDEGAGYYSKMSPNLGRPNGLPFLMRVNPPIQVDAIRNTGTLLVNRF